MKRYKFHYACLFIMAMLFTHVDAKANASASKTNVFEVVNKNATLSPYTGMTRQHWKDAARYLLEGVFSYVHTLDDPLDFPKQPGKSYPKTDAMVPVAKLEALCRTMFIAGPLLKEDPDLVINNIHVGDYYRNQITRLLQEGTPTYIAMNPPKHNGGQVLVEMGGLAVSFMLAPEVFWDPLPQTVKDALAERILSYGDNETIEMNWRFFNINIMSFFKSRGYKTNDAYLEYLVRRSLEDYRSHGWYSDSPYFDYYSMWAFQMYGTIWAKCFGEEYYPQYAKEFLDHLSEIPANYTHMFGRNGKMIMWGRSIIYRMGAAIPLALTGMLNDADYNYGWMRYITSSTILQFLQHPDFLKDGIPTLGFYGAFEPAVQLYSCRGSVFWLGKLFLALYMPENNPFWQEKENLGDWNTYNNDVQNIYADQANILISDFPNIGAAEIRSTASSVNIGIYHGTENYNRLSYNSEFPWQADGKNGEVAMNYVFKNAKNEWEAIRIYKFKKYENGFYCRDACLASDHENVKLVLTELPIENGILRIDMIKTPKPISVRFGHYALPIKKQAPNTKKTKIDNHDTFVVDNGEYKLGMINWNGWDEMEFVKSKGLHPETEESIVIDAESEVLYERLFISVLLFDKASNRLDCPIKDIKYSRNSKKVVVLFKNGTEKEVTLW